jgi:hypothetical protein
MFGGDNVLRFLKTPSGKKDKVKVPVFRPVDILKSFPSLDREGIVLFIVLCSGNYPTWLPGLGPVKPSKLLVKLWGDPWVNRPRRTPLPFGVNSCKHISQASEAHLKFLPTSPAPMLPASVRTKGFG